MDVERELRQVGLWKCARGHVLGEVCEDLMGRRYLGVYRNTLTPTLSLPREERRDASQPRESVGVLRKGEGESGGEVAVLLTGKSKAEVICPVCGGVRAWYPTRESAGVLRKKGVGLP